MNYLKMKAGLARGWGGGPSRALPYQAAMNRGVASRRYTTQPAGRNWGYGGMASRGGGYVPRAAKMGAAPPSTIGRVSSGKVARVVPLRGGMGRAMPAGASAKARSGPKKKLKKRLLMRAGASGAMGRVMPNRGRARKLPIRRV